MTEGLIFCVDGGGTRSRARLVDCGGSVLTEAEAGACNASTNLGRAVDSFSALWRDCAETIGHDPARTSDVALSAGVAGLYIGAARVAFLAAIPPFARTIAMSDGYAALIGAGGGEPCGLVVVGTGVAGHRLWNDGLSTQRDGWGWIAGDRGGGAWLGTRALRHACATVDGTAPRDGLSERVLNELGGTRRLPEMIRGITPDRLAAFAPLVLAAAMEGVPIAVAIRERAVKHLADLARVLDLGPTDALYAAGGLAASLAPLIAKRLGRIVALPTRDALHGCYLIAAGRAPEERPREDRWEYVP